MHPTFTGRRNDLETRLYYYRNRCYAPHLGLFIQRDPIGYADGLNLYHAYFAPSATDPSGLMTLLECFKAGLAGCGIVSLDPLGGCVVTCIGYRVLLMELGLPTAGPPNSRSCFDECAPSRCTTMPWSDVFRIPAILACALAYVPLCE